MAGLVAKTRRLISSKLACSLLRTRANDDLNDLLAEAVWIHKKIQFRHSFFSGPIIGWQRRHLDGPRRTVPPVPVDVILDARPCPLQAIQLSDVHRARVPMSSLYALLGFAPALYRRTGRWSSNPRRFVDWDVRLGEGFRVPAGVRKPLMQEPAGHSRCLWGFRFLADVGDGVTVSRKRRNRHERTAP